MCIYSGCMGCMYVCMCVCIYIYIVYVCICSDSHHTHAHANAFKQTVRNAFGEFWRTHQDAWPLYKDKFQDEELTALTNLLVSPTYFS